jgi:hypothetical protein
MTFRSMCVGRLLPGAMLFVALFASVPSISSAWSLFGPSSYAECVVETMKDQKSGHALHYAHEYCFDEFCRDRGDSVEVDNSDEVIECERRRAIYDDTRARLRRRDDQLKSLGCAPPSLYPYNDRRRLEIDCDLERIQRMTGFVSARGSCKKLEVYGKCIEIRLEGPHEFEIQEMRRCDGIKPRSWRKFEYDDPTCKSK